MAKISTFLAFLRQKSALILAPLPLWAAAAIIGVTSSLIVIFFLRSVDFLQIVNFGSTQAMLHGSSASISGWRIVGLTTIGGLLIGLLLHCFAPQNRFGAISEVIQSRMQANDDKPFPAYSGVTSLLSAIISLGFGLSGGREGPAVHAGASFVGFWAQFCKISRRKRQILIASAAGSAVSALFNAPIAGVLFAHEVILRHYAPSAIAPVSIACVIAAITSRLVLGDETLFALASLELRSYWELPAFFLLGVVCAFVAAIFIRAVHFVEMLHGYFSWPIWLKSGLAGALVGCIALQFPAVLGAGYQTTKMILQQSPGFWALILLLGAKMAACAITLGGRAGTGVFSPSVFIGIATGAAFGQVASQIFPEFAAPVELYALIGMGAVCAAILGAPLSTTLICFELTNNYQIAIFVLLAASVAWVMSQILVGGSFFTLALARRGVRFDYEDYNIALGDLTAANLAIKAQNMEDFVEIPANMPLAQALELMEEQNIHTLALRCQEKNFHLRKADIEIYLTKKLHDLYLEEHR